MKWIATAHKGLRYYEHATRKHGKRRDRYYSVRFKVDGRDYTYGIGWVSDGIPEEARKADPNMGFEEFCLTQLRLFKANAKAGSGAKSPKEKRRIASEKEAQLKKEEERKAKEAVTFGAFFTNTYIPAAKLEKKPSSSAREEGLFKKWIKPVLNNVPLRNITPLNLEKIKHNMVAKGRAPASVVYALAVVRQALHYARDKRIIETLPVVFTRRKQNRADAVSAGKVILPKVENERRRYLTPAEAEKLLTALKEKSQDVHDMTLLGLHGGLRFSEIASLTWADVDLAAGKLNIRNAKSEAGTREVYLTAKARQMLAARTQGKGSELVFQNRDGGKYDRVSHTFWRVVKDLGLNKNVEDRKDKVVFHSTRHSYGTALYNATRDLYVVQRGMGHSQISQTARYSKVQRQTLKDAAKAVERAFKVKAERKGKVIRLADRGGREA